MASKLVKNATAPTPTAAAAMMVTSAAWKRRSHSSAACTLGSPMLGIPGGVLIGGLGLGWAAGGAAALRLCIGWRSLGSAAGGGTAAEHDGGDGQAQPSDGDRAGDGQHHGDGGGRVHPAQRLQRQHRRRQAGRLRLVEVVDLDRRARLAAVYWLQQWWFLPCQMRVQRVAECEWRRGGNAQRSWPSSLPGWSGGRSAARSASLGSASSSHPGS